MPSPAFPIHDVLPAVLQALDQGTRLVLEAPPGAGKTTQVPLALLQQPWCSGKKILLLEPRRVAARAAAAFMARQLGESVGDTVGYRIRFDNKVSAHTRVEVVTEGILTRMIQDDPALEGVGALLFDEFHERHLASDLGLALALDVQESLRPDLRLLVMSATLDGERLARLLGAERISSAGRSYPVQLQYLPPERDEALAQQVRRCLTLALEQHAGDVLVFLPGQREISEVARLLERDPFRACQVLPLYGEMPVEQQAAALQPASDGRRRLVLATNLAESSVTLPGVRVVIDSGLAREPRVDPQSGFSRLQTVWISQASADQRCGRAGRVAAGWCYRLWPRTQRLDASRTPEICNVDLSGLALELAAWGSSALCFIDPPPPGPLAAARDLLAALGALDVAHRLTARGKRMLALGTHPRLAALLLSGHNAAESAAACDLVALIDARDPLIGYRGDDWQRRWQALADQRQPRAVRATAAALPRDGDSDATGPGVSRAAVQAILQTATAWRQRLQLTAPPPSDFPPRALGDVLVHAYPDRIARVHASDRQRYQLSNGRMARLADGSALLGEPWLVASELRYESKDSLILRAAPVDEQRLREDFADRFTETDVVRWDAVARALVARRESRFDQILLDARPAGRPDPQRAAAALCEAVAGSGLQSLPWSEALQQWRARVRCLRVWLPELGLPDLGDEALLTSLPQWLQPAFLGKTRLDALSADELTEALKADVGWATRQRIDQLAPVRITVPSGLERAIHYEAGAPPVLAVKLQELFGLAETPRIAGGKVPLTLHLLSPGGKPLQITQDLRSFWERTYPEVRREMKGRYPRHPWPDDPWQATATHRAKPRGT